MTYYPKQPKPLQDPNIPWASPSFWHEDREVITGPTSVDSYSEGPLPNHELKNRNLASDSTSIMSRQTFVCATLDTCPLEFDLTRFQHITRLTVLKSYSQELQPSELLRPGFRARTLQKVGDGLNKVGRGFNNLGQACTNGAHHLKQRANNPPKHRG